MEGQIINDANTLKTNLKLIIMMLIIKKGWQCNAGRAQLTPCKSKHPSPTIPNYGIK